MKTNDSSVSNISLSSDLNADQVAVSHLRTEGTIATSVGNQTSEISQRQSTMWAHVLSPAIPVSKNTMESSELNIISKPTTSALFRVDRPSSIDIRRDCSKHITVTGAVPPVDLEPGVLVEIIRNPMNLASMVFLRWEDSQDATFASIEYKGHIYLPPDPTFMPSLSLPASLGPCGDPSEMLSEVGDTISKFVILPFRQLEIVSAFVLASWFPDCFEAAPQLWIVGPLGSGKTKLLKVLWCMCRRGLIAGDMPPGSIYKLVDNWQPTLLIDEFELGRSVASSELLRMLRSGSAPAVPIFRNGQQFSTYGLKVIASRQPCNDAALLSRGLVISMLPAAENTPSLDEAAMRALEKEWQAKLCMFRLLNFETVKRHYHDPNRLKGLTGRMRQIGMALTAPFGEHHQCLSTLHGILVEHDVEDKTERSLEPEWLVVEVLLEQYHEGRECGSGKQEILVSEVADHMNEKLKKQNEHVRLSAKKVGLILRSLGIQTCRLGSAGRGLNFSNSLPREIHEIASQLGMLQRAVRQPKESSNPPACYFCEEYRPRR